MSCAHFSRYINLTRVRVTPRGFSRNIRDLPSEGQCRLAPRGCSSPRKTRNFRNARRRKSYRGKTARSTLITEFLCRARKKSEGKSQGRQESLSLSRGPTNNFAGGPGDRGGLLSLKGRTIISIVPGFEEPPRRRRVPLEVRLGRVNNLLRRVRRSGLELISAD